MTSTQRDDVEKRLWENLKAKSAKVRNLFQAVNDEHGYEDPVYRFYHQSFKVFRLQQTTARIVAALQELLPDHPLHPWFLQIVQDGTGKEFTPNDNERWLEVTRPIVEAFFHARFFLELACRHTEAKDTDDTVTNWKDHAGNPLQVTVLSSGKAALLYLFNLR